MKTLFSGPFDLKLDLLLHSLSFMFDIEVSANGYINSLAGDFESRTFHLSPMHPLNAEAS